MHSEALYGASPREKEARVSSNRLVRVWAARSLQVNI
jgi:hypothetical protein